MIARVIYFAIGFMLATYACQTIFDPIHETKSMLVLARDAYKLGCVEQTKKEGPCQKLSEKYYENLLSLWN